MNFLHMTSSLLTQGALAGHDRLVDQLLLFVGYFALENERNQAMLNWQKAALEGSQSLGVLQVRPTMRSAEDCTVADTTLQPHIGVRHCNCCALQQRWCVLCVCVCVQIMCTKVPFDYFSDTKKMHVLFPTLIIAAYRNQSSRAVLEREISMELLIEYIGDATAAAAAAEAGSGEGAAAEEGGGGAGAAGGADAQVDFANRFPPRLWADARSFFAASLEEPS